MQAVSLGATQHMGGIQAPLQKVLEAPYRSQVLPKCGDYFARPDSKKRHYEDNNQKIYKEACRNTSPEEAREKKQKVERLLRKFEASLDHHLRNGGEIKPFSEVMNEKLTNTSKKKVSKQETTRSHGPLDHIRDPLYLSHFLPFTKPAVRLQRGDTNDIIPLITYILFLFRLVVVLLITYRI